MTTRKKEGRAKRLPIRTRRTLSGDGETAQTQSVHCGRRDESVAVAECEVCERCEGVDATHVTCRVHGERTDVWDRITRRVLPPAIERTPIATVMQPDVVCVTPDLSLETLTGLFLERDISGAPVVNEEGFPIGVVSKTDLLRRAHEASDATEERAVPGLDGARGFHLEPAPQTVADVMMPIAFTLCDRDSLGKAAALMTTERVHRLPVVSDDGKVVGILTTLDLARWLAREAGYSA